VAADVVLVEREFEIAARPETVWPLLVDERKVARWMGVDAAFQARPGGRYRVEVIPGHTALGEFLEIDPPRRLVFSWGWESGKPIPPGSSTVEFELVPRGEGTLVRFRHSGLAPAAALTHSRGWDHYLPRLGIAATGADPGTDPWIRGGMQ
jgi:uncharacterized protein YndB with AHSA1/START domain